MKERPIIFGGESVRAILAGTKTQTRRLFWSREGSKRMLATHVTPIATGVEWWAEPFGWEKCPYGVPGDRLWVRESGWHHVEHYGEDDWDPPETAEFFRWSASPRIGRRRWMARSEGRIEDITFLHETTPLDRAPAGQRRSPYGMPRWASRITLEVTEVRVQRLQEISEEDALAEGCEPYVTGPEWQADRYRPTFRDLWDSINGKRAPWDSNPWVWAITFKRLP